jgi:hypothetical protein
MRWAVDRFHIVQVGEGWTAWDVLGEVAMKQVA